MKNSIKIFSKGSIGGFTLVETLVALSILSLAIAGTLTAIQKGIQSSTYAKDQITAFYLTQEGMEFIKNIRDENALHSVAGGTNHWLTGLSDQTTDPCYFGKTCTVDSDLKIIATCPGGFGSCPVLRQDPISSLMGYNSSWTPTTFNREIQFQQITLNEAEVIIKMSWTSHGTAKSFQITESIFNRQ